MKTDRLNKIGRMTAIISFLIGTLLLTLFYFTVGFNVSIAGVILLWPVGAEAEPRDIRSLASVLDIPNRPKVVELELKQPKSVAFSGRDFVVHWESVTLEEACGGSAFNASLFEEVSGERVTLTIVAQGSSRPTALGGLLVQGSIENESLFHSDSGAPCLRLAIAAREPALIAIAFMTGADFDPDLGVIIASGSVQPVRRIVDAFDNAEVVRGLHGLSRIPPLQGSVRSLEDFRRLQDFLRWIREKRAEGEFSRFLERTSIPKEIVDYWSDQVGKPIADEQIRHFALAAAGASPVVFELVMAMAHLGPDPQLWEASREFLSSRIRDFAVEDVPEEFVEQHLASYASWLRLLQILDEIELDSATPNKFDQSPDGSRR